MMRHALVLSGARQRGMALPIVLILLTVMLISSLYLVKSTTSTTMATANLAYDSALSKAADLGLHTAFQYLSTVSKETLLQHDSVNGYRATINPAQSISSSDYWEGSAHVTDTAGNEIEYVIHRMCMFAGDYNATAPANRCTLTSSKSKVGSATKLGESLSSDRSEYNAIPELHYVVTARIYGARGGNVVTQAVVMMGP
ncbi:pilus assembly PilX family protein [Pseudoduganella rivuli]|nr:hypothetical protein [Pseudoduganella rivuli]